MAHSILLIDDEEKFAAMLKELLGKYGYASEYCLNPEEALQRMKEGDFDLVISDYKMPEMDGSEFLTEARKISPELPVIMVSGLMNMPELIKVANIGVTLVLEKPFDTEDFIEHVARFVRPKEEERGEAVVGEVLEGSAGPEEVAYPSPARFMADASAESRRFLDRLWTALAGKRHLFVQAGRGMETRLLTKELLDWLEAEPEQSLPLLDLLDTGTDFSRDWLRGQERFPPLVVVDIRGCAEKDFHPMLADWIRFVEGLGTDLTEGRLLYLLPVGTRVDPDKLPLEESLQALIDTEGYLLAPLRERLADIATYFRRLLPPPVLAGLDEEARELLLHYSWPGGYEELHHWARQLEKAAAEGPLEAGRIGEWLRQRTEDPQSVPARPCLESYLKRRQREYVEAHRRDGESWSDVMARLGVDPLRADEEAVLGEVTLVLPEVLEEVKAGIDGR